MLIFLCRTGLRSANAHLISFHYAEGGLCQRVCITCFLGGLFFQKLSSKFQQIVFVIGGLLTDFGRKRLIKVCSWNLQVSAYWQFAYLSWKKVNQNKEISWVLLFWVIWTRNMSHQKSDLDGYWLFRYKSNVDGNFKVRECVLRAYKIFWPTSGGRRALRRWEVLIKTLEWRVLHPGKRVQRV